MGGRTWRNYAGKVGNERVEGKGLEAGRSDKESAVCGKGCRAGAGVLERVLDGGGDVAAEGWGVGVRGGGAAVGMDEGEES